MTPGTMMSTNNLARLEQLLAHLPFHIDDMPRANAAYRAWMKYDRAEDQRVVDLWTYCFVWRNLIVKFTRNADLNPSDFDLLVTQIFERIVSQRYTVRDDAKYTNWVSVICRNSFVNYLRGLKRNQPVENMDLMAAEDEPIRHYEDFIVLNQMLNSAISRLPAYLQHVVRQRLMSQRSYEDISEEMGKSVDVVRSYFNKAMNKLRSDVQFRALIKKEFREDIENEVS